MQYNIYFIVVFIIHLCHMVWRGVSVMV